MLSGRTDLARVRDGPPGRDPRGHRRTRRQDRDGQALRRHGEFSDVMSIDPAFLARIERLFPGRDYQSPEDAAARARQLLRAATGAAPCSPST